ncbi:3'-5' exonuclease [Thioalkalicoccus limnaeus]|uniref:DNA 3'-5' helicase II n=1 Tax=Thioalkalicoccus limnaeus TaxID=120681 RepID=A0ABV4BI21_9GAMM
MAIMIPDRCPSRASQGEKRLFAILQGLPDQCLVYYEPIIENRYPDFIVLCPDLGVLIIEVKGWRPNDLLGGNQESVTIKDVRGPIEQRHPVRQAREYMYDLMDRLRKLPGGQRLLNGPGPHQNRFAFPFGHFAVLANIAAEQLTRTAGGDMTALFSASKVVTRDRLLSWEEKPLAGAELEAELKAFFDPFWTIEPLREEQIDVLRAAIHPEVVIRAPTEQLAEEKDIRADDESVVDLKVLDARQESNARSIGGGHRIIYGVAGSGKTVLLIAKARMIAGQQPDRRVLFLCYNVSLATYLQHASRDCPNVTVLHFDGWAKANGVARRSGEDNQSLGHRLLAALESGAPHSRFFNSILVDEAQDFEISWFKCLLEAIDDPDDGDLIIVGDGSQGLYGDKKIIWRQLGINARGRTISKHFDLHINYRNSKEIVDLAAAFASRTADEEGEESLIALQVDPARCRRLGGHRPRLLQASSRLEEQERVMGVVKGLLDGQWFGQPIEPLAPRQIAIFYPYAAKHEKYLIERLVQGLEQLAPAVWINRDPSQRRRIAEPAIKIQTIHSAKGLQYKAVILMWADLLPKQFGDTTEQDERKLMYVGLTRPEDYLVISAAHPSPFVTEIAGSGKVEMG